MHFGEPVSEDHFTRIVQHAWKQGIRTFMTADVYGQGAADTLLGESLAGTPRDSYCLVGAVGHDYYATRRDGAKGFPRFTHPGLRPARDYADYLRMATEKSLQRCKADHFDLVLLHNPDSVGYSSEAVWTGMHKLKETGLARQIGVAPGPANGFTLDILLCFERFGSLVDWAMIILNPLEPWPGGLSLPAARKHNVNLITRVVDHGGLFHDDVKPGHTFGPSDHRVYRAPGWVEAGCAKIDRMRPYAENYGLSLLQFACLWNLSQAPVKSVIPTLIQEVEGRSIETKIDDLASLPDVEISAEDIQAIADIGDNTGCMELKGGNSAYEGEPVADRWRLNPDLEAVARKWGLDPSKDLACTHTETA